MGGWLFYFLRGILVRANVTLNTCTLDRHSKSAPGKCTLKVLYDHVLLPRVLVSACPQPLIKQWPVARCGQQFATILILKLKLEIDLHLGGRWDTGGVTEITIALCLDQNIPPRSSAWIKHVCVWSSGAARPCSTWHFLPNLWTVRSRGSNDLGNLGRETTITTSMIRGNIDSSKLS